MVCRRHHEQADGEEVLTPVVSASSQASSVQPTEPDETLVVRCWAGEDEALDLLLTRYRAAVRNKARSYFLAGADREDVVQEGMIGLYKAVRDFDPSHQSSFRSFADLCVTRQIISAVKSATRQKHTPLNSYVSLHLPAHHDDDAGAEIVDEIAAEAMDPAEAVVSAAELTMLEEYFAEILSDLEAEVLQRYVEGETYVEIADALNRHTKSIDNALQRIKKKLDSYLARRHFVEAEVAEGVAKTG
ncbi:RNA polymerase sporulation sigma factor SigH [soil metagenome]